MVQFSVNLMLVNSQTVINKINTKKRNEKSNQNKTVIILLREKR